MAFLDLHRGMGLIALALVACGGSTSETPSSAPETFPDPTPPEAPRKRGSIALWSINGSFLAQASFWDVSPGTASSPCEFYALKRDEHRSSDNAGPINIEVPTPDGPHPLTLEFDPKATRYTLGQFDGLGRRPDSPNQRIRIRADGANVPAFSTGIDTASDVEFALEFPEGERDFAIKRDTGDIKVRWSENVNDDVFASLDLWGASVFCKWPASDVGGIIPGAMVQQAWKRYVEEMPRMKCTGSHCTSFFLASVRRTEVPIGEHDVLVSHALATIRPVPVVVP